MHVLYLHGFASSPASSKAQFFGERFAERGVPYLCPDLNAPEFSTLTVSRMLCQTEQVIAGLRPDAVALIGSSLGGFLAIEVAARQAAVAHGPVSHLVLLAPAVELEWDRWSEIGPGGVDRWRRAGAIEVFHYAENRPARLNFSFYEDSQRYRPAARRLALPVLIFQGRQDESVSPALVERFAKAQPDATLHLLEDGHQLLDHLDFMWAEIERFLSLPGHS
jgi:pimeloyl-ACP methyl ester carboxylesterase